MAADGRGTKLLGLPYRVVRHEHLKTEPKLILVALHCIGFPTEGVQPAVWEFVIKVSMADLGKFPLGKSVYLTVTS